MTTVTNLFYSQVGESQNGELVLNVKLAMETHNSVDSLGGRFWGVAVSTYHQLLFLTATTALSMCLGLPPAMRLA